MALTRDFQETVKARLEKDHEFCDALFREALELFLAGDLSTAKAVLRDYVNGTVGFPSLAQALNLPSKSLMRMLSATGNPSASHLFALIAHLQKSAAAPFDSEPDA